MKKKVLIAGSTGFIGRNLYEYLYNKENIELNTINSSQIDFLEESMVEDHLRNNRYDVIVHCANYGIGRNPCNDFAKVLEYNLRMFLNFEKCSAYYGKLLYLGSGAEYDKRYDIINVNENEIGKHIPIDHYGLYKYTVNKIIANSNNIYNLRLFGIFGKYEDWRVKFISNLCCKAIVGIPLTIRQNLYFDYLWIDDFCRVVEYFINNDIKHKDYNVVTGERISLLDIAKLVNEISGKQLPIYIGKDGLGNEYTGSNERLLEEMPGLVYTKIQDSIRLLYNWYESNKEIIDIYPLLYQ